MKGMLGNALDVVNQLLFMKHYTPQLASLRSQISEELGHKEAVSSNDRQGKEGGGRLWCRAEQAGAGCRGLVGRLSYTVEACLMLDADAVRRPCM